MRRFILIILPFLFCVGIAFPYETTYPYYATSLHATIVNITDEGNFSHLSISQNSPYDTLIGYWNFDDNTSINKVTDYSNVGRDSKLGTYLGDGNAIRKDGIFGNYFWNDGVDDDNPINISYAGEIIGNITISSWFTLEKGVSQSPNLIVFGWAHISAFSNTKGRILCDFSNETLGGSGRPYKQSDNPVNDSQWHHIVCRYNGTDVSMWLDGVKQITYDPVAKMTNKIATTAYSQIGAGGFGYNEQSPWNGSIDEVMIFNSSLTEDQISDIYNNQSSRFVYSGNLTYNFTLERNFTIYSFSNEYLINHNSSINISLKFYNGSWHNSSIRNYIINDNFNLGSLVRNLNFTFSLFSGSNNFWSPLFFLPLNITASYGNYSKNFTNGWNLLPQTWHENVNMSILAETTNASIISWFNTSNQSFRTYISGFDINSNISIPFGEIYFAYYSYNAIYAVPDTSDDRYYNFTNDGWYLQYSKNESGATMLSINKTIGDNATAYSYFNNSNKKFKNAFPKYTFNMNMKVPYFDCFWVYMQH